MKKRILTGIQSSGKPHLGNILGAIQPAIELSKNKNNETICFIANTHSLTTIKDANIRIENTYSILATFIALGYDPIENIIFKQSDVHTSSELSFYLSCFSNFNLLSKSHAFKEKSENLNNINVGLFTYPILMASDILLYDADYIPVGKDQLQHIEICRAIASSVNNTYKKNVFKLPEPYIQESLMTIPGIDGRKMSKSYNNYIDIFLPDKQLRKKIMSIQTDSTGVNDPKNFETCNIFKIYSSIADVKDIEILKDEYRNGIMYSKAKQNLYDLIVNKFNAARVEYTKLVNDKSYLDDILNINKEKAYNISIKKMAEFKSIVGL